MISANTSSGRRVTPICVVPGSTASCAFGRGSNISTTSDNGQNPGRRRSAWPAPRVTAARRSTPGTRAPSPAPGPRTRRSERCRERPCCRPPASPGNRPPWASGSRRAARSRPGGRWASAEATISLPTRVGASSATAYTTRPPRLKPKRSASAILRWSSSATTSPASASIVMARSVSAVCPWPWSSTAITCLLAARGSSNRPKFDSIVIRPP